MGPLRRPVDWPLHATKQRMAPPNVPSKSEEVLVYLDSEPFQPSNVHRCSSNFYSDSEKLQTYALFYTIPTTLPKSQD